MFAHLAITDRAHNSHNAMKYFLIFKPNGKGVMLNLIQVNYRRINLYLYGTLTASEI